MEERQRDPEGVTSITPNDNPVVVLPLANIVDHTELRHALRSMHEMLGVTEVYIIGERIPEWYTGDVLYCKQGNDRWANTSNALLTARDELGDISALYYHDDFFAMSHTARQVLEPSTWYRGSLRDYALNNRRSTTYRNGAVHALRLLGDEAKNYELHIPILINLQGMAEAIHTMRHHELSEAYKRTVYCHEAGIGEGFGLREDVKVRDITPGWLGDWLSTSNGHWHRGTAGARVQATFTSPSPWESIDTLAEVDHAI